MLICFYFQARYKEKGIEIADNQISQVHIIVYLDIFHIILVCLLNVLHCVAKFSKLFCKVRPF